MMWELVQKSVSIFVVTGILVRAGGGHEISFERIRRASGSCRLHEFRCSDGGCIASDFLCDGKAECADGSDETRLQCMKPEITCSQVAFRCSYGACVDGDVTCDGKNDCIDRSDETLPECATTPSTGSGAAARSNCNRNQFRCGMGQCIDDTFVCNGFPDCTDRSDETLMACGTNQCSPFNFRCKYGACIDGDKRCDGVRHCADGSDEDDITCSEPLKSRIPVARQPTPDRNPIQPVKPIPPVSCTTPLGIENGYWKLQSSECGDQEYCEPRRGVDMTPGTHIVFFCNSGYQLIGSGGVYCKRDGSWSHMPQCKEIRCKVLDTRSTEAECSFNGVQKPCNVPVVPGTRAEVSCRTSYRPEDSRWQQSQVRCDSKGEWDPEPITCIPVCGTRPPDQRPLMVHARSTNITEFPWHATIYVPAVNSSKKQFLCGATVIAEQLLITAAHCIYDEEFKEPYPPEIFDIATGNLKQDYDYVYTGANFVRKAKVKKIYMHCGYRGKVGYFEKDIAILQIEPALLFTPFLVPLCLDTTSKTSAVDQTGHGEVAGFGLTENKTYGSELLALSVPVVPKQTCIEDNRDLNAQAYLAKDKFCAGYQNGSSVCNGDSGGGLAFKTNRLWYLRGIVSTGVGRIQIGPDTWMCDNHRYAVYTEVFSFISWIRDIMFKVERGQTIPECPRRERFT